VILEERVAAARWKTGRAGEVLLVSVRGEVFAAAGGETCPCWQVLRDGGVMWSATRSSNRWWRPWAWR